MTPRSKIFALSSVFIDGEGAALHDWLSETLSISQPPSLCVDRSVRFDLSYFFSNVCLSSQHKHKLQVLTQSSTRQWLLASISIAVIDACHRLSSRSANREPPIIVEIIRKRWWNPNLSCVQKNRNCRGTSLAYHMGVLYMDENVTRRTLDLWVLIPPLSKVHNSNVCISYFYLWI